METFMNIYKLQKQLSSANTFLESLELMWTFKTLSIYVAFLHLNKAFIKMVIRFSIYMIYLSPWSKYIDLLV